MVHWLGDPCVMYYWKYGQKSTVTVPMGVSSNTPLHDTWSTGSREIGWGLIHMEMVWSDLGMMYDVQLDNI